MQKATPLGLPVSDYSGITSSVSAGHSGASVGAEPRGFDADFVSSLVDPNLDLYNSLYGNESGGLSYHSYLTEEGSSKYLDQIYGAPSQSQLQDVYTSLSLPGGLGHGNELAGFSTETASLSHSGSGEIHHKHAQSSPKAVGLSALGGLITNDSSITTDLTDLSAGIHQLAIGQQFVGSSLLDENRSRSSTFEREREASLKADSQHLSSPIVGVDQIHSNFELKH
jgi:hypothetical protein